MPEFIVVDERYSSRVRRQFEMLIRNGVITGIDFKSLQAWWLNFETSEEQYLAAHLLDSLVYRTESMLQSSSRHIVHMILPNILENVGKKRWADLSDFLSRTRAGDKTLRLRIGSVDGNFENAQGVVTKTVAKSGPALLRLFKRATGVDDAMLLTPDCIRSLRLDQCDALILLDDCLGTGTQFENFARAYQLERQPEQRAVIYIPYVAHTKGIDHLKKQCPRVHVTPVETLGDSADFFSGDKDDQALWRRDKTNSVAVTRYFYEELLRRKTGSKGEGHYNLNLSLAFHGATPNNSLKAFYTDDAGWRPLFKR